MTPIADSKSMISRWPSFNSVRNKYSETSNRIIAERNIMVYFVFIFQKKGLHPAALTQTQLFVGYTT